VTGPSRGFDKQSFGVSRPRRRARERRLESLVGLWWGLVRVSVWASLRGGVSLSVLVARGAKLVDMR
jgi:hypothetical protein